MKTELIKDIKTDLDNGVYTSFVRLGSKLESIVKKLSKGKKLSEHENEILKENQYI